MCYICCGGVAHELDVNKPIRPIIPQDYEKTAYSYVLLPNAQPFKIVLGFKHSNDDQYRTLHDRL